MPTPGVVVVTLGAAVPATPVGPVVPVPAGVLLVGPTPAPGTGAVTVPPTDVCGALLAPGTVAPAPGGDPSPPGVVVMVTVSFGGVPPVVTVV
jgi:hypothetical protein